jgi:hypothetical protein
LGWVNLSHEKRKELIIAEKVETVLSQRFGDLFGVQIKFSIAVTCGSGIRVMFRKSIDTTGVARFFSAQTYQNGEKINK